MRLNANELQAQHESERTLPLRHPRLHCHYLAHSAPDLNLPLLLLQLRRRQWPPRLLHWPQHLKHRPRTMVREQQQPVHAAARLVQFVHKDRALRCER